MGYSNRRTYQALYGWNLVNLIHLINLLVCGKPVRFDLIDTIDMIEKSETHFATTL